jgi:hypothetical protein
VIGVVLGVASGAVVIGAEEYWRRHRPAPIIPPPRPLSETECVLQLVNRQHQVIHEVYSHSWESVPDELIYSGVTYYQTHGEHGIYTFEAST